MTKPNLHDYDLVVVNTSAGKDSQAMLDLVVAHADATGFPRSRIVCFHADLGRVEWPGTPELAAEHAAHYGLRFVKRARPQGDLLDHVVDRHRKLRARGDTTTPAWPSSTARWCTSDHKRGQGRVVMTALVNELTRTQRLLSRTGIRPARLLNCMGFRREESPARAKKEAFRYDAGASGKGRVRRVWEWCPILDWTADDVWARIRQAGTRHHWAYDEGMPRLSCCLCVLAGKDALVRGAQLMPALAQEYLAVEQEVGHTFRQDLSMADIIAAASSETVGPIKDWNA